MTRESRDPLSVLREGLDFAWIADALDDLSDRVLKEGASVGALRNQAKLLRKAIPQQETAHAKA